MDAITTYEAKITADEQVDKWLSKFGTAASAANIDALLALFHADASWRDLLAFTWNIGTAEGRDAIREMLGACLARTAPLAWRRKGPVRRTSVTLAAQRLKEAGAIQSNGRGSIES